MDIISWNCFVRIPMGEKKMTYMPCSKGNSKKYKNFGIFVRKEGCFSPDDLPMEGKQICDMCHNVATFEFKNKSSINTLIQMLEYFRDNEYNKTDEELISAQEERNTKHQIKKIRKKISDKNTDKN